MSLCLTSSVPKVGCKFGRDQINIREDLHLHLGHLADAFVQSDLQYVHLLGESAISRVRISQE